MKRSARRGNWLFLYLILNIIISALTTTAVIFWDRSQRSSTDFQEKNAQATLIVLLATPTRVSPVGVIGQDLTPPPPTQTIIEIQGVIGAGDVNFEMVVIKKIGDGDLSMAGWKLKDDQNTEFIFPALALYKDGVIQVFSKDGSNTPTNLYWNRNKPVWKSGKIATLVDPQGNIRATYKVP